MLFRSNDTATTEIYTVPYTLSLHDALPNFADAAGNLHLAGNLGILAYITVPVAVISLWAAYYMTQLQARPLINVNDPHVEEMLEPEHAH